MHLFVYGTLRFGDVRWRFLEPFVVNEGSADSARGQLFDTGAGYPAALFDTSHQIILGHRYELIPDRQDEALGVLDEVESAVTGLYHRVRIVTELGFECWAYQYGLSIDDPALRLQHISSGDWFARDS